MKSLNLITNTLLLLILISVLSILLWGMNKGFDITDEGFTLLLYQYPQEYTFTGSTFHILGNKLFAWLNPDIITYKFLRLILTLCASFIFAGGFWVWLQKNDLVQNHSPVNFITLTSFLMLGCLIYYSSSHQIASYNPANSHLMLIACGILLLALSSHKKLTNTEKQPFLLVSVGIIIAIQFFVKFSSAVSLLILCALLVLLHFRKILPIMYLIIGIIVGGFLYFIFFQDYQTWLSGSVESLKLVSSTSNYSPIQLLETYFTYFILTLGKYLIIEFFALFLGIFLSMRLFLNYQHHQRLRERYLLISTTIFLYLFLLYQGYRLELYKGGGHHTIYWENSTHIYVVVLLACFSASFAILWDKIQWASFSKENLNTIGVILLLIAIPVIGMVGTNNVSSSAFKPYLLSWFALIILLLVYINQHVKISLIASITMIIIALFVLAQTISGVIYSHYRLADIRVKQTETVEGIKALKDIKVDIQTKQFFEQLNEIVKSKTSFQEGDPIVAAYDMPGIVYALGGISPGTPWYFVENKSLQKMNCEALSRTKLTNLDRTLLLMQWNTYKEFYTCMMQHFAKWGIASFEKVGEVKNPYTKQMVRIFAPKTVKQKNTSPKNNDG